MKNILNRCGELWCEYMHNGAMWPIHGAYRCRQCLRTRQVPWNESTYATARRPAVAINKKGLLAA